MQEVSRGKLGAYLRKLRDGYGYTLREIEEKSEKIGHQIDNSQLSRFEKGQTIPSFEKLKVLAEIFNISIQSFSDIVDLSMYDAYKPLSSDYSKLIREGEIEYNLGNFGMAYAIFERALEVVETLKDEAHRELRIAEARMKIATALKALGRLHMCENELRWVLRNSKNLPVKMNARVLLQLAYVNREFGDFYVATILARECLKLATSEGDTEMQAAILNTLGNIAYDEERFKEAQEHYEEALSLLERMTDKEELKVKVMVNLGGSYISNGLFPKGFTMIDRAFKAARERGYKRTAALALTRMGEAYMSKGQFSMARRCFRDSDMLSDRQEGKYSDILFLNSYRQWEIYRRERNEVQEKIYFRRLKQLRTHIERRFPEVYKFDNFIEKVGKKNENNNH
ncbi:MAG: helix-turn-helix transcriptional regulator [Acidobacteriota bacterium]